LSSLSESRISEHLLCLLHGVLALVLQIG